jgi:hypothetical protein
MFDDCPLYLNKSKIRRIINADKITIVDNQRSRRLHGYGYETTLLSCLMFYKTTDFMTIDFT